MPSRCWKSMCQNDTKLEPGSDRNVVSKVSNKRMRAKDILTQTKPIFNDTGQDICKIKLLPSY